MGFRTNLIHLLQAKKTDPHIAFELLVDAAVAAPVTRPEGPSADAALLWRAQLSPVLELEYAAFEAKDGQPLTEKLLVTRLARDEETGRLLDESPLLQLTRVRGDITEITHMSPNRGDILEVNRAMYRQIGLLERKRSDRMLA